MCVCEQWILRVDSTCESVDLLHRVERGFHREEKKESCGKIMTSHNSVWCAGEEVLIVVAGRSPFTAGTSC